MTSRPSSKSEYTPIADYGAIGNLRTVALVSTSGAIDWCCLPDLDSPSVFAALLDHRRGGRFRVAPAGPSRSAQAYEPGTNILRTTFAAEGGTLTVADFMPLAEDDQPPALYRIVRCDAGEVEVAVEWSPRFDYARARTAMRLVAGGAIASAGERQLVLGGVGDGAAIRDEHGGPALRARFRMRTGERRMLATRFGSADPTCAEPQCRDAYETTRRWWLKWVGKRGFGGQWHDQVVRSGLALKLLTHPHTGALAAAATTSLPEEIGGVRNWDYRYTWIRDSAFTVQALFSLGHHDEALSFLDWLANVVRKGHARSELQVMYGLHGETELPEMTLEHLEGYRGSRPVRIGNAAAKQRQLDVYGELVGAAYEVLRRGAKMPPVLWRFLSGVVDVAARTWREPDHGIWEVRGGPKHFVYSKVMVWVALDRALHLAKHFGLKGNTAQWRTAREEVRAAVLREGYDTQLGAFVQSFGSKALDAANLLIPVMGFLPFDDPRVQGTIDRTLERLTDNGLVYRYLTDDGLPGGEGAFGLATFWMVDVLALSGRIDEAQELLHGMAGRANHLGLFAEEFDPKTGELLGNFPQAFTHTGFVNASLYVTHALGIKHKTPAPMGSQEHRAEVGH